MKYNVISDYKPSFEFLFIREWVCWYSSVGDTQGVFYRREIKCYLENKHLTLSVDIVCKLE